MIAALSKGFSRVGLCEICGASRSGLKEVG